MKELLIWSLRLAREQTIGLVDNIPPERSCAQGVTGEQHPVWALGHLILADAYLLMLLGTEPLPPDFQQLLARFGPGANATADPAQYDSLEALRLRLTDLGDQRQRAITSMSEAALVQATPDPILARAQPTIGHHLQALVFHEGYHAGKLAAWRRSHGLAPSRWAFAQPSA